MNRRLYRCRENRVIAGVASGVAEFLGLDPTLVRVLWFLSIFFGGVSLLLYIGLAIIVPLEPLPAGAAATTEAVERHRHGAGGGGRWVTFFGIALILLGGLALLNAVVPAIATARFVGPLFFIGIGAVLVFGAMRRDGPAAAATAPSATVPPSAAVPPQESTDS